MEELYSSIVQPPFLTIGDKVAIVSPAYQSEEEIVTSTAALLRSWGLEPVFAPGAGRAVDGSYSGTADERAAEMRWAMEQPDVRAIICSRGGYGSVHLLNRIPPAVVGKDPKWLIGQGDITTLLCAQVAAGVMAIHGPMAFQLSAGMDARPLRDLLFGVLPQYEIGPNKHNKTGVATGILVGGNLTSFSSLAGTRHYLAPGHDIILFMEDVEESLHHIDRLFYMLSLQNLMSRLRGIIIGEFNSIRYDLQFESVEEMLIGHLHGHDIPVCCGFPVGSSHSMPLIEGAPARLEVTPQGATLTLNVEGLQQPTVADSHPTELLFRPAMKE